MTPVEKINKLLQEDGIVVLPGAADALIARIIENTGFPAVYMTGAGVSYSTLGMPDVGLLTMTEMVQRAAYIVEALSIPLIADADTGYGEILNIRRTVAEFEKAGTAGIQIEDQVMPKKCGHLRNKQIVSREEALRRIKVALDARKNDEFLIIARTDARAVLGLEEAIERGHAFAETGADVIFIEAPQSLEEMRKINEEIAAPTLANMVEGGKTPLISVKELEELGYKMVIFPNSATRIIAAKVTRLMNELMRKGCTTDFLEEMMDFGELNKMLGIEELEKVDKYYG